MIEAERDLNLGKTLVLCAILFAILWHFEILRVHPDTECRGIDIQKHGEPAYPQVSISSKFEDQTQPFSFYLIFNPILRLHMVMDGTLKVNFQWKFLIWQMQVIWAEEEEM